MKKQKNAHKTAKYQYVVIISNPRFLSQIAVRATKYDMVCSNPSLSK